MGKSHPFSIYLLKSKFDADNSIEDDSELVEITTATQLPPRSRLFVSDNINGQPWWKSYFGVPKGEKELPLTSKGGAIVYIALRKMLCDDIWANTSQN